jgi:hypothetical protein
MAFFAKKLTFSLPAAEGRGFAPRLEGRKACGKGGPIATDFAWAQALRMMDISIYPYCIVA